MTIVKIHLYEDSDDTILVLASSDEEVQKIKDAAEDFSLLDNIYTGRDEKHSQYKEAATVIEGGLSEYLVGKGFTVPCTETISL